MSGVAELELVMRVSEDPSVRLGDLQDTLWEESIQGVHSMKFKLWIPSGGSPMLIPISSLIDDPKIVMLKIDGEALVYIGSISSTPYAIEPGIGRYAYFIITAGAARILYIDPITDPGVEVVICATGDE